MPVRLLHPISDERAVESCTVQESMDALIHCQKHASLTVDMAIVQSDSQGIARQGESPSESIKVHAGDLAQRYATNNEQPRHAFPNYALPEEVSSVRGPVLFGHILNCEQAFTILFVLVLLGKNGQPGQYCPQAILFSHMVTASTKGFLTTYRALACTSQLLSAMHDAGQTTPPTMSQTNDACAACGKCQQ